MTIIEKRKNFIINVLYAALIIAIVYISIKYLLGLLLPFLIGFTVPMLLKPAINFVSEKLHLHKKTVAIVLILLFYIVAGFFLSWIGLKAFNALKDGIIRLPEIYIAYIEPAIHDIFDYTEEATARLDPAMIQTIGNIASVLSQSVESVISNISSTVIRFLSSSAASVPGLFMGVIVAIISSLFFAVDYGKITGYLIKLFPAQRQGVFAEIKAFATGIGLKYVKAYLALITITFLELAAGLSLLRVDGAVTIAALIAVIDILPVLGTGTVVIPWAVIELIKGNTALAVGLAVLYGIIAVVRNILESKLVGKQIGLHPLVMLMSIYIGAKVFGFIGIFALPVAVVILKHLYDHKKQPDNPASAETV
ncbi:MAG TPA: sporulation integral membrane protein YtvI [Feifaniaceae bacterium]|nr:sporulation integral membrane protein YtvI [Feifaniaceae bacterium]